MAVWRRAGGWLAALVAGLAVSGCARTAETPAAEPPAAPAPAPVDSEAWYGAYLQGRKIGYMSEVVRPLERAGQALLEYVGTNSVELDVLGQAMSQTSVSVTVCDLDFRPLEQTFTLTSAGRETVVTATFDPTGVRYTKTGGGSTVSGSVPVPEGVELVVDAQALVGRRRLLAGESLTVHQFNPVTFQIEPQTLTGAGRSGLEREGQTVQAEQLTLVSPQLTADLWVGEGGELLELRTKMMAAELIFRREPREVATAGHEGGERVDLVVASAIRPATPIVDAAGCARLELLVGGLEKLKEIPGDGWQTVAPAADGRRRVVIDTAAIKFDEQLAYPLPPAALTADLKPYLAATPYIEAEEPELVAAARTAVGDAETCREAIRRLHDLVHQRIRWSADIGLFRSALEIWRDPAGVCRDSAALYTALARAAGIPTRVCAGLVYVRGAFMGHAWAESWCGGWLPVDATTPGDFVNATHLTLARGAQYTCVFDMLPALAGLTIEVVAQRSREE